MRLDKEDYPYVRDQRKHFMARFMEELKRAAVETLTPVGQQDENERERSIEELDEQFRVQRDAGSYTDPKPGPIRDFNGNIYDSLKDYVNRFERNRHRR